MEILSMPRYKCHKEVGALKIREIIKHAHPNPAADDAAFEASDRFNGAFLFPTDNAYKPIEVDAAWFRKHQPSPGGYYVVYEDGYASYSPAAAFESGYFRMPQQSVGSVAKYSIDHMRLDKSFKYHAPIGDQAPRYVDLRFAGRNLAESIMAYSPPSREQSVALTKVEEAVMWANAAIARNELPTEKPVEAPELAPGEARQG